MDSEVEQEFLRLRQVRAVKAARNVAELQRLRDRPPFSFSVVKRREEEPRPYMYVNPFLISLF